jgi:hypothetical protein
VNYHGAAVAKAGCHAASLTRQQLKKMFAAV